MGLKFTSLRGTKDITSSEVSLWRWTEEISRQIFLLYGYQEIRTPLIERADLFVRSLGDDTEVIQKQMFLLKRGRELIALRPEGTAGIVRAYLEHNFHRAAESSLTKFFYIGPMFRGERPQKGRLRQFHHIGAEVIGSYKPGVDAEVIALAWHILDELKVQNASLKINNLGCLKDKALLKDILKKELSAEAGRLCQACRVRLKRNPLRILDCKRPGCRDVVSGLNLTGEHLCLDCRSHFKEVKKWLELLKINYEVCPYLVRGLDYYNRTVFEISHPRLGAQDALGAGGRYDNLVEELGGSPKGAAGFAFGLERVILAYEPKERRSLPAPKRIYLATLGERAREKGFRLCAQLRRHKVPAFMNYDDKSLRQQMKEADRMGADFVVFIGEDEIEKKRLAIRDMSSGRQKDIEENKLVQELLKQISV
jgi:histidyl-tRNA synthetase